jgi:hypothetical protein
MMRMERHAGCQNRWVTWPWTRPRREKGAGLRTVLPGQGPGPLDMLS